MTDIACDEQLSGTVRLYDIDRAAAERNKIIGEKIAAHPDAKSHWDYEVAGSLREALTGADFVVISILPATFEEMRSDVHLPERVGVYQPVGDTVGPGGFMRAMRTIPMFVEIGQAIRDYAPDAWVINYTNPMTLCIRTLYEVFPGIKAFGCCHEVFGTQKVLVTALEEVCGITGVSREEIEVNPVSVNHFTWLTKAQYKNMDLYPVYAEFVSRYKETGYTKNLDNNWMNNSFATNQRVKFDLFDRYGYIAAAGDRHLAEFCDGNWYLKDYSGEVFIYGTLDAEGNTRNFLSLGLNEGDIVKITGPKQTYGSSTEMVDVTVEAHYPVTDISISDFLTAEQYDKYYRLTGTIRNIQNTTYGNFDLVDDYGNSVYVYGLVSGYGGPKRMFEELGLNEGDTITLVGNPKLYNGVIQVANAFYVSRQSSPDQLQ